MNSTVVYKWHSLGKLNIYRPVSNFHSVHLPHSRVLPCISCGLPCFNCLKVQGIQTKPSASGGRHLGRYMVMGHDRHSKEAFTCRSALASSAPWDVHVGASSPSLGGSDTTLHQIRGLSVLSFSQDRFCIQRAPACRQASALGQGSSCVFLT